MQLCHTPRATSAVFDDPNLVSAAGLVPVLALAASAGLQELAQRHLSVPTDKGANAGLKVAGMVAGADSIDGMTLLRHGGMGKMFTNAYAPSTLGSFLRAFTFGHVRQLDAAASRFLVRLDLRLVEGLGTTVFDVPEKPDYPAPDGSLIYLMGEEPAGGLAFCDLPAGTESTPVRHKQVRELWYVVDGSGQISRRASQDSDPVVDDLHTQQGQRPGAAQSSWRGHASTRPR